jgi:hypothetical protein
VHLRTAIDADVKLGDAIPREDDSVLAGHDLDAHAVVWPAEKFDGFDGGIVEFVYNHGVFFQAFARFAAKQNRARAFSMGAAGLLSPDPARFLLDTCGLALCFKCGIELTTALLRAHLRACLL